MTRSPWQGDSPARTALIVAHPGHELRVWRWLELVRPVVLVVTDGSGRSGTSRLASTARLIEQCSASIGAVFGGLADQTLYRAVLDGDATMFLHLTDRLADALVGGDIECVAGDAAEGCILAHDLLRVVRRAAVRQAESRLGRPIPQYEFALERRPDVCPPAAAGGAWRRRLEPVQLARKVAAARSYVEVRPFVDAALREYGEQAFADECLFPSTSESLLVRGPNGEFAYEMHGRRQVEAGHYREAILFERHVRPIIDSLSSICRDAA